MQWNKRLCTTTDASQDQQSRRHSRAANECAVGLAGCAEALPWIDVRSGLAWLAGRLDGRMDG